MFLLFTDFLYFFFIFFFFINLFCCVFFCFYYYYYCFYYCFGFCLFCFFIFLFFLCIYTFKYNDVTALSFNFEITFFFFKFNLFQFYFDKISVLFAVLVSFIFLFSLQFSYFYLYRESGKPIFIFFLFLFLLSMYVIFFSNNIFLLYIGWEFMGLCSFFLIGYYNFKIAVFKSTLKAFFFNKISDFFFLFACILHYVIYDSFVLNRGVGDSVRLYYDCFFFKIDLRVLLLCCVSIFSFIKSAQLICSIWLLDSMDAPVPASALIHSATLVISGIFIMYRFFGLYAEYYWFTAYVILLASFTAAISSFAATVQIDIKKILAYSTISNCSFIIIFLFFTNTNYFLAYIYIHGLLKSCVFLVAGFFFFFNNHSQSINKLDFNVLNSYAKYVLVLLLLVLGFLPFTFLYDLKHSLLCLRFFTSFYFFCIFKFNILLSFFFTIQYIVNIIKSVLNNYSKGSKYRYLSYKCVSFFFIFTNAHLIILKFFFFLFIFCGFLFIFLDFNVFYLSNFFFFFDVLFLFILVYCFIYFNMFFFKKNFFFIQFLICLQVLFYFIL